MSRIPVNMSSPELDACPVCKALIYKAEGVWLDIFLPDHADTDAPHKHQPNQTLTGYTVKTEAGALHRYYAVDEADARSMHEAAEPGDVIDTVSITPPPGAPLATF